MIVDIKSRYSLSFLKYIRKNGFHPKLYNQILELGSSLTTSMSQFIKDGNSYFLSRTVTEQELREKDMQGVNGYLTTHGQIRSIESYYGYYINEMETAVPNVVGYTDISSFDAIIYNIKDATYAFENLPFGENQDVFIGCCIPLDDTQYFNDADAMQALLFAQFKRLSKKDKNFQFLVQSNPDENKEYCLIRRLHEKAK